MAYVDLKNDVVFRKVFGRHPRVLAGLLNDLLGREGERAIVALEYLPSEQAPLVMGMKLSILDVRCRERGGATFVVEMQVLHVTGFMNRVFYNACKAYVGTLERGLPYSKLVDVMAVSICDFELWPDAARDAEGSPRVPLVSRWSMAEHTSGARSLGQVQYVFVELPKLGDKRPDTVNERWATIFSHAPELTPEGVKEVPLTEAQREALECAREEAFSPEEREAIARSFEEVDQVRRTIAAAEARTAAAEAKAAEEARARAEAEAKTAEAEAKTAEAETKAAEEARARAEAEAKAAEAEAKAADAHAKAADAHAKAAEAARARADAEARIRALEALLAKKS